MSKYENFAGIPALPVELDFDPVREPAKRIAKNGNVQVIPGVFNIVNPNTDTVMTVSKSKHNPVNYNLMWQSFMDGIMASGIDTSQVEATPRCTPPMPPVAKTAIPACADPINVPLTVVAPSTPLASAKGMSRREIFHTPSSVAKACNISASQPTWI